MLVERRVRDHTRRLVRGATRGERSRRAADVLARRYRETAAQHQRGDDEFLLRRILLDLVREQRGEPARALGVADEHDAAAVVVALEIRVPRLYHVGLSKGAGLGV